MDETFIASIVMDIIRGMTYLHKNSSIGVHGNLKSSNCLVTSRWVVKLSGFGLPNIRNKFKEDRGKTTCFIKLYIYVYLRLPEYRHLTLCTNLFAFWLGTLDSLCTWIIHALYKA